MKTETQAVVLSDVADFFARHQKQCLMFSQLQSLCDFFFECQHFLSSQLRALGRAILRFAEFLNKWKYIQIPYGLLDGLILSYSSIRYLFDVIYTIQQTLSSNDAMYFWLCTPEGIAVAALGSIAFMLLSAIANYFPDDHKNWIIRKVIEYWPFWRDITKGLKNGYKSMRSFLAIVQAMIGVTGPSVSYLMFPLGISVGVLSASTRILYRFIVENRKKLQNANQELLTRILLAKDLTLEDAKKFYGEIHYQGYGLRISGLILSMMNGLFDGLYYYMGAIILSGLAVVCPPAFFAMAGFCFTYTIFCILTRVNDEYDFQRRMQITAVNAEYGLYAQLAKKYINHHLEQLRAIEVALTRDDLPEHERKSLEELQQTNLASIRLILDEYQHKRTEVQSLMKRSYLRAALVGVKDGLAIYSVLASVFFMVMIFGSFTCLATAPWMAWLVVGIICTSAVFISGFTLWRCYQNYQFNKTVRENALTDPLNSFVTNIEQGNIRGRAQSDKIIEDSLKVKVMNFSIVMDVTEVFRFLLGSGPSKAAKAVGFVANPAQILDKTGHYNDSPAMLVFSCFGTILFSLVFALRALARLGKSVDLAVVQPEPIKSLSSNSDGPLLPDYGPVYEQEAKEEEENIEEEYIPKPIQYNLRVPQSLSILSSFTKKKPVEYLPAPSPIHC